MPAPRRARAGRRHRLLLPLRDQGRQVGLAGRAGAEVLAELVRRRRAPGPDREAVRASRLGGRRARSPRVFRERTRDEWTAFAGEHDCCLEPILDLDEVLDSELVAGARHGRRARPARHRPGEAGRRADQAVAHAGRHERRRAGAGRGHRRGAARGRHRPASRCATREWCERRSAENGTAADARAGRGRRRVGRARSSTTCARGCCPSRSRRRATWPGTRASSSSACS